jgi:hypothetical protein
MSKKNIHVTRRAARSWAVIGEGDARASSLHDTQRDAIEEGRQLAMKQGPPKCLPQQLRRSRVSDEASYDTK